MGKTLFFDGADNMLKSSIIEKIVENTTTRFHKIHYSKPSKGVINPEKYMYTFNLEMFEMIKNTGLNFLIDRCHLSECVWSSLYRGYVPSTNIWDLEREYKDLDATLILITDSNYDKWKTRDDNKGLGFYDKRTFDTVNDKFKEEYINSHFNKVHIDLSDYYLSDNSTKIDIDTIVNVLIKTLLK